MANNTCQITGIPTTPQEAQTYTITATNANGTDSATVEIVVSTNTVIPTNLTATAGNQQISLSWGSVDGASYNLYYAQESITDIQNYAALNGGTLLNNLSGNTKTVTGLTNDTPYYFVVTAVKNNIESSASNEALATPKTPTTPTTAGVLNDTGITWGGDYPSGNNTTCTGDTISAQDCTHGRDAQAAAGTLSKVGGGMAGFDFTKLGSTGNVLSVQNQPWTAGGAGTESAGTKWSCVRDNVTGLVWEVKTDEGSADSDTTDNTHTNIHHKDNTYRWGGKTAIGKTHTSKAGTYYEDWTGLVDGSNSASGLCGFSDWKVPTINELDSIAHKGKTNPSIDNHYFPNTVANYFWSSSPDAGNASDAWLLHFYNGYGNDDLRYNSNRVRLVRPGQ